MTIDRVLALLDSIIWYCMHQRPWSMKWAPSGCNRGFRKRHRAHKQSLSLFSKAIGPWPATAGNSAPFWKKTKSRTLAPFLFATSFSTWTATFHPSTFSTVKYREEANVSFLALSSHPSPPHISHPFSSEEMAALPTLHTCSHGFSGKPSLSSATASTIFPSNMSLVFGDLSSLCCRSIRTRQRPKSARRSHGLHRSWPLVRAAVDAQPSDITSKESDDRVRVSPLPPPPLF